MRVIVAKHLIFLGAGNRTILLFAPAPFTGNQPSLARAGRVGVPCKDGCGASLKKRKWPVWVCDNCARSRPAYHPAGLFVISRPTLTALSTGKMVRLLASRTFFLLCPLRKEQGQTIGTWCFRAGPQQGWGFFKIDHLFPLARPTHAATRRPGPQDSQLSPRIIQRKGSGLHGGPGQYWGRVLRHDGHGLRMIGNRNSWSPPASKFPLVKLQGSRGRTTGAGISLMHIGPAQSERQPMARLDPSRQMAVEIMQMPGCCGLSVSAVFRESPGR